MCLPKVDEQDAGTMIVPFDDDEILEQRGLSKDLIRNKKARLQARFLLAEEKDPPPRRIEKRKAAPGGGRTVTVKAASGGGRSINGRWVPNQVPATKLDSGKKRKTDW
jgi:hypothetical protein